MPGVGFQHVLRSPPWPETETRIFQAFAIAVRSISMAKSNRRRSLIPAFATWLRPYPAFTIFRPPGKSRTNDLRLADSGERVNLAWLLPKTYGTWSGAARPFETWSGLSCGNDRSLAGSCRLHAAGLRMGLPHSATTTPPRAPRLNPIFPMRATTICSCPTSSSTRNQTRPDRPAPADPHLVASVVDEDREGITIRGAKMLATSGIMATNCWSRVSRPCRLVMRPMPLPP